MATGHAFAQGVVGDASNFVFFKQINDFLRDEIDVFQWTLLSNTAMVAGSVALMLLTAWILFQGFRIITGRTQLPMMALVGDALRAGLIIGIAVAAAGASSTIYWGMTDGTSSAISKLVSDNPSPYDSIDKNLAYVQLMFTAIDAVSAGMNGGFNAETGDAKDRAKWFTGIGIAGPGVVAGSALLLNKIAIALFVGLGPLFILCLLFEQTKSLFSRWLFYGIGTLFSLAVLSVMVELSTRMVGAVAISILGKYAALATASSLTDSLGLGDISSALTSAMGGNDGITSMAMQQGGLGLVLSTLIISAPPMAASFFQGTLGQFAAYSAFGAVGVKGGNGGSDSQALAQGRIPTGSSPTTDSSTATPTKHPSIGQGSFGANVPQSDTVGTTRQGVPA
jgi:type IV secretion system protein VirB6